MSEFKGTKGKWILIENEYCHYTSIRNEDNTRTLFVSRVNNQIINNANFKLISKAPEMLEMLERLVNSNKNEIDYIKGEAKQLIKEATEL